MEIETKGTEEALELLGRAGYAIAARLAREEIEALKLRTLRAERENPNTRSTLRAHFASKALEGILAIDGRVNAHDVARDAWSYADAMLETRDERKPIDVAALVERIRKAAREPEFRSARALADDLLRLVADLEHPAILVDFEVPRDDTKAEAAKVVEVLGRLGFANKSIASRRFGVWRKA